MPEPPATGVGSLRVARDFPPRLRAGAPTWVGTAREARDFPPRLRGVGWWWWSCGEGAVVGGAEGGVDPEAQGDGDLAGADHVGGRVLEVGDRAGDAADPVEP